MKTRRAIFFVGMMLLFSRCTKDHATSSACNDCSAVSFNHDVVPLLTHNCTTVGCHTGAYPQSNLSFDSAVAYSNATKPGTGYVNAGNPSSSILVQQLYSNGNPHMPPSVQLSDCSIQTISCWVQQGALNN